MQVIADVQEHRQHQPNKLLPVAEAAVVRAQLVVVLSVAELSTLTDRWLAVPVAALRLAMLSEPLWFRPKSLRSELFRRPFTTPKLVSVGTTLPSAFHEPRPRLKPTRFKFQRLKSRKLTTPFKFQ
jgi:hypothetical protein